MHRGRKARLDRLIRRAGEGDRAAVERHHVLLARAAIGAADTLEPRASGIDPARAPALLSPTKLPPSLPHRAIRRRLCSAEPPACDRDLPSRPVVVASTTASAGSWRAIAVGRADTRSRAGLARRTAGLVHRRRRSRRLYLSANAGCRFAADSVIASTPGRRGGGGQGLRCVACQSAARGIGRPRFSRSVGPAYSFWNRPRRCNSGTSSRTTSS